MCARVLIWYNLGDKSKQELAATVHATRLRDKEVGRLRRELGQVRARLAAVSAGVTLGSEPETWEFCRAGPRARTCSATRIFQIQCTKKNLTAC